MLAVWQSHILSVVIGPVCFSSAIPVALVSPMHGKQAAIACRSTGRGLSFKHTEQMCGGMGSHHLLKRRVQEGHLPHTEVEEAKGTNIAMPPGDAGDLFLSENPAFPPAL